MLSTKEEVIEFVERFGFKLEISRWEQENEAINPKPFMRFKWIDESTQVKGGFFFTVYKQDRGQQIIDKLIEALILIGKKSKEYELQKFVFEEFKS